MHRRTVRRIYSNLLNKRVITPNASLELFNDELTQLWFRSPSIQLQWKIKKVPLGIFSAVK